MKKRIKGGGGLSRKLLTILVLSAMTTSGMAADNSIYIDQSGDNSTITMTQDGSGNKVKGILLNGTAGGTTDHGDGRFRGRRNAVRRHAGSEPYPGRAAADPAFPSDPAAGCRCGESHR